MRSRRLFRACVLLALTTGVGAAGAGAPPGQQPPISTSPPAIAGEAQAGSTLTASTGTWTGKGLEFGFSWQRCGSNGEGCVGAGAGGSTYTLEAADVGFTIRVEVVAQNRKGTASSVSNPTAVVAPAPGGSTPPPTAPSVTGAPTIVGTAKQGQTLNGSAGTWSGTQPLNYAYQWQRCGSGGSSCAAIAGATAGSYTLGAADVGAAIKLAATASNTAGATTALSAATATVAPLTTTTTTTSVNPYWNGDFNAGDYCNYFVVFQANSVNSALESWGGLDGCAYTPWAKSTSQRVYLTQSVAPPAGSRSAWASRHELRTTDSDWGGTGLDKSTIRLTTAQTFGGAFQVGMTRWFRFSFYLPNNSPAGEYYNWPGNDWQNFFSIHTGGTSYEPINGSVRRKDGAYSGHPRAMLFSLEGATAGSAQEIVPFLDLTDASGARVAASYNRWHTLLLGVTFSDQGQIGNSPGRLTIVFDGQTIYDKARPTMRTGDMGQYLAFQNYKRHVSGYWNGATSSVIYFADLMAGRTRADVGG